MASEDPILSININSSVGKEAFGLVRIVKSLEFPKGNHKIEWNRLVDKYATHTAFFFEVEE